MAYFNNIKHQPPRFSSKSMNLWMFTNIASLLLKVFYYLFPAAFILQWSLLNLIYPTLIHSIKQNTLSFVLYSII